MESIPTSPAPHILSDEPKLSSAALCTSLRFLDTNFRPEFTHQCVASESFRGHRPVASVVKQEMEKFPQQHISSAEKQCILHSSHVGADGALFELDLRITLAPSCRQCHVQVHRSSVARPETSIEDPPQKKVKFLHTGTEEDANPVSPKEIQESISRALPSIVPTMETVEKDFLSKVLGKPVLRYSVYDKATSQESKFVISVADGVEAAPYHSEVQKLSLWFIENADDVDLADENSGFWKVLYIFRQHSDDEKKESFSLVGFMTLFHFNAPFHKPTPGIIVRICQALVLPPYQGQGHGKRMMQSIYDIVHKKIPGIYPDGPASYIAQVNVEDPAPGFVALRNKTDLHFLSSHPEWWTSSSPNASIPTFVALPDSSAQDISVSSKITTRQVQIVHELRQLQLLLDSGDPNPSEEMIKPFRLMVKKRLNREHREEMGQFESKDEKKAFLGKLFDEEYERYLSIVKTSPKK